jgi:hypothetical protein
MAGDAKAEFWSLKNVNGSSSFEEPFFKEGSKKT